MKNPSKSLPITQDLLLELLAARYRTGETLWTFSAKASQAANALEQLGLITVMSGNIEGFIRASLTTSGIAASISETYKSPLAEELALVRAELKDTKKLLDYAWKRRSGPDW